MDIQICGYEVIQSHFRFAQELPLYSPWFEYPPLLPSLLRLGRVVARAQNLLLAPLFAHFHRQPDLYQVLRGFQPFSRWIVKVEYLLDVCLSKEIKMIGNCLSVKVINSCIPLEKSSAALAFLAMYLAGSQTAVPHFPLRIEAKD